MNLPKSPGSGNTFCEIHIGHIENVVGADAVEHDMYFINGRQVTKEEFVNYDDDKE